MSNECKHPKDDVRCTDCEDNMNNCNCFSCMNAHCSNCGHWFNVGCQEVKADKEGFVHE